MKKIYLICIAAYFLLVANVFAQAGGGVGPSPDSSIIPDVTSDMNIPTINVVGGSADVFGKVYNPSGCSYFSRFEGEFLVKYRTTKIPKKIL